MTLGYTMVGQGAEHVLVFHGWTSDHSVWSPIFPALDTDTFTYVFPDYRGYGKSKHIKGRYTMQEIANDMIELLDHLGWRQFHMIGHSMGAMAMQRLLVDINDWQRVKSAVAVTPVPASGAQLDERSWAMFEASITDDNCRQTIMDFTTGKRLPKVWLEKMVQESRATTIEEEYDSYLKSWIYNDYYEIFIG